MTEQEAFIEKVLVRLDRNYKIESADRPSVISHIGQLEQEGFSADQAFRYTRNTEEVNPELSEYLALKRMAVVQAEVPFKGKGKR